MPKIYELFGFPSDVKTKESEQHRKNALCPFMGIKCDGGGNRYSTEIKLSAHPKLKKYFGAMTEVPSGVCSIQLKENESPWIVCPRRMLVLGKEKVTERNNQNRTDEEILSFLNYKKGEKIGVWSEVKFMIGSPSDEEEKSFHYTFDYIIATIGRVSQSEIEKSCKQEWKELRRTLENAGYTIARRGSEDFVEDFPIGNPNIIEIMTSSTSGGNKKLRTTIPQSFEDAILGKKHIAPNINKRQVWARMVSQLIVKSEVANNWGGKALWLIQDNLASYITSSTALDLRKFISKNLSEVNILNFTYGDLKPNEKGIVELKLKNIFAGPITSSESSKPSFSDMIRTPLLPDIKHLFQRLSESKPVNILTV